jgi:hypothetical protein
VINNVVTPTFDAVKTPSIVALDDNGITASCPRTAYLVKNRNHQLLVSAAAAVNVINGTRRQEG